MMTSQNNYLTTDEECADLAEAAVAHSLAGRGSSRLLILCSGIGLRLH